MNKALLTLIAFMTYMVMSGLMTQIGVLISPLAEYLNVSVTKVASIFSLLTGGTLAGTFIAMWLYGRFTTQRILQVNYLAFILSLILLVFLDSQSLLVVSIFLFVLGIGCGIGLAGGAVLITHLYNEKKRASAFLATDCSFSLAGYIFPSLAIILLSANHLWTLSYAVVGVLAFLIFIGCFILRFPRDTQRNQRDLEPYEPSTKVNIWTPRVILVAFALCCYLTSQTTFLTWAPSYLQEILSLDSTQAASAVGNYWGPSIFGLLTVTLLVMKVPTRPLLLCVLAIAVALSFLLYSTSDPDWFLTVTLGLGFLTSCIFKLGISIGTQQIKNAPPFLVTFLLCSATLGSTIAPALSALVVSTFGVSSAMLMTLIGFSLVAVLICACLVLEHKKG
ncbi:MFS transporter TsgA [Paraglaciecola aquimarina]|uniref:MFS transporter TsgA n=1 Tax=Paraglaciecola algarum TaxID=3050085 RepID=A0ABS9D5Y7_9ALTE|nr:MFS transporter TsgA [Paraglaciecola sp. G1-23]MCF2947437.1 MFS transporter TsgA [Paraglaciecola sp. G1-23]